jgi:hypothetical protein
VLQISALHRRGMRRYARLMRLRARLGIAPRGAEDNVVPCGWTACVNSMLFFDLDVRTHST